MTTAWLAGDGPAPAKPAPVAAAPSACSTCDACNSCDDGCGHKWRDKIRGWFHHDDCGCDTCGTEHKLFKGCGCEAPKPIATCNTCNTCDEGCGHKWRDKIRGWFHRDCDECNTCNSCGAATAAPASTPAEPLKKMPTAEPQKMPASKATTQILTPQPVATTGGLIVE
jgi:hypothetical protein